MTTEFNFQALGKTVDVEFDSNGRGQTLTILFDNYQISSCDGEILNYPREIQAGIVRGAAADAWERKQLREIAEAELASMLREIAEAELASWYNKEGE